MPQESGPKVTQLYNNDKKDFYIDKHCVYNISGMFLDT